MAFGHTKEQPLTPVERATNAISQHKRVFHISLELDEDTDSVVQSIEDLDWKLDRLTFAFVPSKQKARLANADVFGSSAEGDLVGVYLFRR